MNTNEKLDKQIKLNNKIREIEDKLMLIQRAREDKLNITDKSETFEEQLNNLEYEFNTLLKSLYEENKESKEDLKEAIGKLCYIIKLEEEKKEYNKELINRLQNKNKSIEKTVINLKDSIFNIMDIGRFVEENRIKKEKSIVCGFYRIKPAVEKIEITDSNLIPEIFKIEKVSKVRDDKKIKEALLKGEMLNFAILVKDISIQAVSRKKEDEEIENEEY